MDRAAPGPLSANLNWENALLTNLRLLGFPSTEFALSRDLFLRPNKRAFHAVVLFLFEALDKLETGRRFESCRRCSTRRQELDFAKVTCAWLAEIGEEGRLPRVTPSLIAAPQGEKVYEVLTKLSTVVLRRRLVSDLACSERSLLSPPAPPPSGLPHPATWRSASARSLLAGATSERSQLLSRLSRLDPGLATRRAAVRSLEQRYRRAGADVTAAEAELLALRGSDAGGIDVGRLERLQAQWQRLMQRVEGLAPAMRDVAALLQEVQAERGAMAASSLDGSQLAPQVPSQLLQRGRREGGAKEVYSGGRVDLLGLLGAVRAGVRACGGDGGGRKSWKNASIEGSARECLACLQGQIGQLEGLIARVDSTLPGLESSCAALRGSYRQRHPRRSAAATTAVASPPSATPAVQARLSMDTPPQHGALLNGWRSSPTKEDLGALLNLKKKCENTPPSSEGTPRVISSASVTRDAGQGQAPLRHRSSTPPSTSSDGANLSSLNEESLPKVTTGLSARFRLSLDRLGLESSDEGDEEVVEKVEEEDEEDGTSEDIAEAVDATLPRAGFPGDDLGDLVMETSSILLGSSHSDYDDSLEADSLVSI